jgi:acyl carrier protein
MTEMMREPSEVATEVIRQLQVAVPKMRATDLNSRLKEDLGMSSLSLVSTLAKLSASMGVDMLEFTDSDLARLSSVGDLIGLFERERSKQS